MSCQHRMLIRVFCVGHCRVELQSSWRIDNKQCAWQALMPFHLYNEGHEAVHVKNQMDITRSDSGISSAATFFA